MQENKEKLEKQRNDTIVLCRELDEELSRSCPQKWNGSNEDKKAYNCLVCALDSMIAAIAHILNKYQS